MRGGDGETGSFEKGKQKVSAYPTEVDYFHQMITVADGTRLPATDGLRIGPPAPWSEEWSVAADR